MFACSRVVLFDSRRVYFLRGSNDEEMGIPQQRDYQRLVYITPRTFAL